MKHLFLQPQTLIYCPKLNYDIYLLQRGDVIYMLTHADGIVTSVEDKIYISKIEELLSRLTVLSRDLSELSRLS